MAAPARYLGYYGMIVPPKLTESGEDALVRHPVGTGAYKFVRWVKDDRVELEANPDYWGGKPRIGRVTFRAIPNESARLAELLAGSVHLINTVPPELFKPIQDSPKAKLVEGKSLSVFYVIYNLVNIAKERPLADKRCGKRSTTRSTGRRSSPASCTTWVSRWPPSAPT